MRGGDERGISDAPGEHLRSLELNAVIAPV